MFGLQGYGLYHIKRDREYWSLVLEVLAWFWWGHVMPARSMADANGDMAEAECRFMPQVMAPEITSSCRCPCVRRCKDIRRGNFAPAQHIHDLWRAVESAECQC